MSEDSKKPEGQAPQSPSSRVEMIKKDAASMVKNDLLGVDDWKNSKIGAVTGFSSARRSIASMGKTVAESSDRLGTLFESMTAGEAVLELEDADGTASQRFTRSMELHGRSERDLAIMVRNTCWTSWLYLALTLAYVGVIVAWFTIAPTRDPFMILVRMGILPFLLALLFKHSYTNWMLRSRQLAGPLAFITSGNFVPKVK